MNNTNKEVEEIVAEFETKFGNSYLPEEKEDYRDWLTLALTSYREQGVKAALEGHGIEKYIKINLKALTTQEDQLIVKE